MPTNDLLLGVLIGVIAAGLLGFLFQQMRLARKGIGDFFQPQKVILSTKKTPADMLFGCLGGVLSLLFLGLFAILVWYLWQYGL